jgi:hypothetical protein
MGFNSAFKGLNTVMKLQLSLNVGNFLASEGNLQIPKEDPAR